MLFRAPTLIPEEWVAGRRWDAFASSFAITYSLTNLSLSVALRAGPRQSLKVALPSVHVMGIPSVSRAVINEEASGGDNGDLDQKGGNGKTYYLLVEGYGLQDVMGR